MDLAGLTNEMNRLAASEGWHAPGSSRPQMLPNLAASLAIEAAEVLGLCQRSEAAPPTPAALRDESADVTPFFLQLASVTGVDLEQAVSKKLDEDFQRHW
jgi:NTP pyrophosphatase (non-canonical NTP hydrolase)